MSDSNYDAVALLSGGLDSILAVKVVEEQGLKVKCLHFTSPFFGKPQKVSHMARVHNLDIQAIDIGQDYVDMIANRPKHGFGKILNPCVDCKILMLRKARERMEELGASMIISGEVVGQRPMSQRRDALNLISRDAGVRDVLVRPLTAGRIDPSEAEERGLIDRSRLRSISGRGRKDQMALAKHFGMTEIPTPAGGCMLAETESSRRYWPVIEYSPSPQTEDFYLANTGRQFWREGYWLAIGRNQGDNKRMESLARPGDLLFKVAGFPGPLSLGRQFEGKPWPQDIIESAAAFAARFSPKARKHGGPVGVNVSFEGETSQVTVTPLTLEQDLWLEPQWDDAKAAIQRERQRNGQAEG